MAHLTRETDPDARVEQPVGCVPSYDPVRESQVVTDQEAAIVAERRRREAIWYQRYKRKPEPPVLLPSHRAYLEEAGALLVLPKTTTDALVPIYNSLMDDLIPILDGPGVYRDLSNGEMSVYVVRAICLVVCKTKQATPFLRLEEDGPLMTHREFASKILDGLDAAIRADLEPDRINKIRILALMHLHNDGLAGVERSSSYLSQAVCAAWSVSLHCYIPGNTQQEQCDYLWWSLRNFDRLNKPIMGAAPFIIDDTDIGIRRPVTKKDNYRSQVMGVSLKLGDLMTTATKAYKASSRTFVDMCHDFPALSEIISGTDFVHFHNSHRAYLELWYHLAAMLSCRYSGPKTVHYDRRLASADRVLDILSEAGHESLPPLPLVPYAMSMSTTVIYRALRDNERDRNKTYADLKRCCDILDALGQRWTSARGVARITKKLWKLYNSGRQSRNTILAQGGTHVAVGMDKRLEPTTGPYPPHLGPDGEAIDLGVGVTPQVPGPPQSGPCLNTRQTFEGNYNFQGVLAEPWMNMSEASSVPLDRAFYDLFDYGVPDIYRRPSTLEFFHMGNFDDETFEGLNSLSPLDSLNGSGDQLTNFPL